MKSSIKSITVLLFLTGMIPSLHSQTFYVSGNLGISGAAASQNLESQLFIRYEGDNGYYESIVHESASLGRGITITGRGGYNLNSSIALDIGLSYHKGWTTVHSEASEFSYLDCTLSSDLFYINPCLLISGANKKISPYARFGFLTAIGSAYIQIDQRVVPESAPETTARYRNKFSGGIAIGVTASMGITINISDRLALMAEINLVGSSYAPAKKELVLWDINGESTISNLEEWETTVVYVDSYSYDTDGWNENSEGLTQVLQIYLPLSSIGPSVGLRWNF